MEIKINNIKPDESLVAQDAAPEADNRNILEEIKKIDQELRNSTNQSFKRTTYWHQQSTTMENINNEALLKEMSECLLRIESALSQIEALLKNKER